MVSSCTMSMEFTPGECVLCFEPDISKARVLYNAKVMDVMFAKDRKGRRKAEYMVHFQGWNSSWDRAVPESYIIKDSDRNRSLMRRLAEIARRVTKNKSRMRRIDNILKQHFKKRPRFDSDSSSAAESSASSEEEKTEEEDEEDEDSDTETGDDSQFGALNGNHGENQSADEEMSLQPFFQQLEDTEYKEIELELPGNLRKKLEHDCVAINRHAKLVQLPAEPNVITLLEGYVKYFGVNVLCATVEKHRPSTRREQEEEPPESNIDLCKEVMDGLRVFFDFALPSILLYNAEREQYEKLHSSSKPLVKREPDDNMSALQNSPVLPGRRIRSDSTGEPPAKQARLSPRTPFKQEVEDEESDDEDEGPPKRITRKAFAEELRRSSLKSTDTLKVSCPDANDSAPVQSPGASKRGKGSASQAPDSSKKNTKPRGRTMSEKSSQSGKANKDTPAAQKATVLTDRITPPPPITIPCGTSSCSSNADTPTSSAVEQSIFRHREQAVNEIFSWKMLPDEEYRRVPTPPSLIYGAHHLLRLFVRLPDYLGRMPFPRDRLKHLVRHLELFIEHLSSRSSELFPDSVYVSSPDSKAHR